MTRVLINATATAVGAVVTSVLLVLALVPALAGSLDLPGLVVALVSPLLIAYPTSVYLFWQKERLAETLQKLTATHEELAEAHVELAQAHADLARRARLDEMTGLLNRSAFFASLRAARERIQTGALLLVDADHFKQVNDTYGHQQGDEALRLIARAIAGSVRGNDLVGRIGGEEFAVFLNGAGEEEAMRSAERIRRNVEVIRFEPLPGVSLPLSVSIGATRLRAQVTWTELMREADGHLYEAKRHGRNLVVFEGDIRAAA